MSTPPPDVPKPNPFRVQVLHVDRDWEVRILEPTGSSIWSRSHADAEQAETLASTIRQHVSWLSPAKFREYYKLDDPA